MSKPTDGDRADRSGAAEKELWQEQEDTLAAQRGAEYDSRNTLREMVPYVRKVFFEVLREKRFADLPVLIALVEMMRRRDVDPDPGDLALRLVASTAQGPELADEDIIRLRWMAGLTLLDLSRLALREESLDAIPGDVQKLAMVDVPLTGAGIVRLQRLDKLIRLNLEGTQITDVGLDRLGTMRSLRWLNVKRTRVTRAGVDRLKANLPDLEVAS